MRSYLFVSKIRIQTALAYRFNVISTILIQCLVMYAMSSKPQPIPTIPAIPVDNPRYHVTAQKRPLDIYAKVGGSRC